MPDGHCADPSLPLHLDQGRGSSKKESFSLRVSPALHPPERSPPRRVDMAGHGPWVGRIFRLLIGVPNYSSSESYGEKQKLILVGFIVISRKTRTHLDLLSIPWLWGEKIFRDNKSKY